MIAVACWCGERSAAVVRRGCWRGGRCRVDFELARCARCGTVRTAAAALRDGAEGAAGEGSFYRELAPRHLASLETIEQHLRGPRVLDIGCNTGLVLSHLSRRHPQLRLQGIDMDAEAVSRPVAPGLDLRAGSLADQAGPFDMFLAMHVLEHVPELPPFFEALARLAAPRARLYAAVPNLSSFNARLRPLTWGALNPLSHCWHFSPPVFRKMIEARLPNWRVLAMRTSWIWPYRGFPLALANRLFPGDQIELVAERTA